MPGTSAKGDEPRHLAVSGLRGHKMLWLRDLAALAQILAVALGVLGHPAVGGLGAIRYTPYGVGIGGVVLTLKAWPSVGGRGRCPCPRPSAHRPPLSCALPLYHMAQG